jgi:Cu/Ag efflux protein CusF
LRAVEAMTMTYPVKERQLEHLSQGERVTATLVKNGGQLWLDDIAVTTPQGRQR